jgi:hypothetical protein
MPLDVTMVRIYFTEGGQPIESVIQRLHDDHQLPGLTVFRGISGFGRSGALHQTDLLSLSFDQPVVAEFFLPPDQVETVLSSLEPLIRDRPVITWPAKRHDTASSIE